jgi:succinate dehydrogenase / fumarate reductase cytochrome b subunit
MSSRLRFWSSSVGTKVIIALTGFSLVAYLIVHLAGNLLFFLGPETFNGYAHMLISNPLVIPAEIGLLVLFVLHIYKTTAMWLANRRARPQGYEAKAWAGHTSRKSIGSTTMIYSGIITAAFVVLHVKAFKFGPEYPTVVHGEEVRDLHRVVVEAFSQPIYVAFYVVCMVLIGFHLRHGIASAFQSLGADHPGLTPKVLALSRVLAIILGGGFALIPLLVFFGGRP